MKLLITVLTSSDIELLALSYGSVVHQIVPHEALAFMSVHPVIIVNSTTPGYADRVRAAFPKAVVEESVSNGRPGKGHNAEVDYFRAHPEYDWHLPVDGDDVLYPTALWQIISLLANPAEPPAFDVLLFLGLDRVSWRASTGTVMITDNIHLTTAFEEVNHLADESSPLRNPFAPGATMRTMACPTRICMMNRAAVEATEPALRWDETAPMIEDFPPLLAAFAHHLKGSLRMAGTSNRYLYLYNMLNTENASAKFVGNVRAVEEDAAFRNMLAPFRGTEVESRYTELRQVPFVKTSDNTLFLKTMRNKIGFIQSTLVKEYTRRHEAVMAEIARREQLKGTGRKTGAAGRR
jgi:hypothetical protein